MTKLQIHQLTGKTIAGYLLEQTIGGGQYSTIFQCQKKATGNLKALKISLPDPDLQSDLYPTQAQLFITGGLINAEIEPKVLLAEQFSTLKSWSSLNGPVAVDQFIEQDGLAAYSMDLLTGNTLRQLLSKHAVTPEIFLAAAQVVADVEEQTVARNYHGDVKPENIIITDAGPKLIDPGSFGKLEQSNGTVAECAITTPAYYPHLTPNDVMALGIILWEAALGMHPLSNEEPPADYDPLSIDETLIADIDDRAMVGQHFAEPLLYIPMPKVMYPDIAPEFELVLLKVLGLARSTANKLAVGHPYYTVRELISDLNTLHNSNKLYPWRTT